ncbi:hypothetical protein CHS0354_015956 [Potamilus streckersoni]|uniref:prostaglandin-endoperoxide synthase n=1 Tax=Potamilus streckersoni TaxID=2493646 RepID=A0AAE0W368_9BIVA|nr:hypothetical protein CHS0354_015956 [Potamilus streckersoni]
MKDTYWILYVAVVEVMIAVCKTDIASPCCSFPCQNGGVCLTQGYDNYICDCTSTEFYGENCETPTFIKRIKLGLRPSSETQHGILTNYPWFWAVVNYFPSLSNFVMKKVYTMRSAMVDSPPTYTSDHSYITWEAAANLSYFTRALPPVPLDCPTPLGVWGKKTLPDAQVIVNMFLRREKFIPDPMGSNALFAFFAQHFTHQFFKTDFKRGPGFQWGGHGVDVSHIYGKDKGVENILRSFNNGKLRVQEINGEDWPPLLENANVPMTYPPSVPKENQFALGHKDYGLLPGLFMYATIWVREHNRVCDVLKKEHPEWDDEHLFQTAKLIIIGETIKIVIEDYVQHLSNYNFKLTFKPELLFDVPHQYQNRIAVEFNHLYHWHPLMPDSFNISGTVYTVKDFMFRPDLVIKHGMNNFVVGMIKQRAGRMSHHNHHPLTLHVAKETIEHGRQLRFQSLNQYRKRFGLPPIKSFLELTGDETLAKDLEELYGDIDGLEFYVGLMMEKLRHKAIFGSSLIEIGGPFSVKGLMSNPICSPKYWKPSTFGGEVGFNIIQTASLKKLFCNNMKGDCPSVSFRVPDFIEGDVEEEVKNCCHKDSNSNGSKNKKTEL